jgi:hypothetical protein
MLFIDLSDALAAMPPCCSVVPCNDSYVSLSAVPKEKLHVFHYDSHKACLYTQRSKSTGSKQVLGAESLFNHSASDEDSSSLELSCGPIAFSCEPRLRGASREATRIPYIARCLVSLSVDTTCFSNTSNSAMMLTLCLLPDPGNSSSKTPGTES